MRMSKMMGWNIWKAKKRKRGKKNANTGYEAHAMRMHESNQQQAYKSWRIWDTRLFLPYLCGAEKPYPVWQLWQFRHAPMGNALGKAVLRWLQSFSLAARLGEWAVSRLFKTHHLENCIWLGSLGKAFENMPDPFTREHNKDLLTFLSKASNLHSSEFFVLINRLFRGETLLLQTKRRQISLTPMD